MVLKFTYSARRRAINAEDLENVPLPARLEGLRKTIQNNESEIVKSLKHVLTERNQNHIPIRTSLGPATALQRRPALQDITNVPRDTKKQDKHAVILRDPPSVASSPVVLTNDGTPVIKRNQDRRALKKKKTERSGTTGKKRAKELPKPMPPDPKDLNIVIRPEDLDGKIWVLRKQI